MTGKAHVHASIDQRFHHQENVSRASRAQCCRHIDLSFVLDAHGFAQRLEHRTDRALLCFRLPPSVAVQAVIPCPICAGVFGIARTTAGCNQLFGDGFGLRAGHDRNNELSRAEWRLSVRAAPYSDAAA